ncbi:MAG: DUF4402 domain-containing protein [Bacteroidota bacterium]|nr:DUF4402 domain-containing protein [Bacteroidota bacterium]
MKRLKKIIYSLICLLLLNWININAQVNIPVSATGHIFAEILPVYSATETSQLNFGRFSPGIQGGSLILTPQSTLSVQGSVFKGAGTPNAASFLVTGDIDAAYSITLPSGPVIITNTRNAKTMQVVDWVSEPSAGLNTGMLQDGFQVVYVGATLKVGTLYDNPVGIYTGSFAITFDFY